MHVKGLHFEVISMCLGSIRVKLANACTRINFEAIETCLVFIQTTF